MRSNLDDVARDSSSFRGILTLFNEIYLPSALPFFTALLPRVAEDPPDIMVVDMATLGAQDVALRTNVPIVINNPSLEFSVEGPPAHIPAWGTGFSKRMSLWERCMNLLFPRLLSVALTPPFMHLNKLRWEHHMPPHRSQHDLFLRARMLVNAGFGVDYPRRTSPLVVFTGPIMPPTKELGELPSDVERWLREAPVVYVSFGSLVQPQPRHIRDILDGLAAESMHVLWTMPVEQQDRLPSPMPAGMRVFGIGELSHLALLTHPAVRAVVSHCGLAGAQEPLMASKPLLCIPFYADQPDVAARVEDAGAGVTLARDFISATAVRVGVREVLLNTSYTAAARNAGLLLRAAGGTAAAADAIESSLAAGHSHLVPPDLELPWHKAAMLDVVATAAAAVTALAVFVYLVFVCTAHGIAVLVGLDDLAAPRETSEAGMTLDEAAAVAGLTPENLQALASLPKAKLAAAARQMSIRAHGAASRR